MRIELKTRRRGFTLIEFIVVVAVLVLMALLLMPTGTGDKARPERINCGNNLKQVGVAFNQWAQDHSARFPMQESVTNGGAMELAQSGAVFASFLVMSNELNTPKILWCPAAKRPKANKSFAQGLANSNINYFVGLDAEVSMPQMFLSGDDNLMVGGEPAIHGVAIKAMAVKPGVLSLSTNTPVAWSEVRHKKQGNAGLADGSVQPFSTAKLREALQHTGMATNRLVFP